MKFQLILAVIREADTCEDVKLWSHAQTALGGIATWLKLVGRSVAYLIKALSPFLVFALVFRQDGWSFRC